MSKWRKPLFSDFFLLGVFCISNLKRNMKGLKKKKKKKNSPQEAIIGRSGCLAIDLMLPEHFPKKHPNSFPSVKNY